MQVILYLLIQRLFQKKDLKMKQMNGIMINVKISNKITEPRRIAAAEALICCPLNNLSVIHQIILP